MRDSDGHELKVGDKVIIKAEIMGERGNNLVVKIRDGYEVYVLGTDVTKQPDDPSEFAMSAPLMAADPR